MLIGEIVNPSDSYTIDCTDWEAACFAVIWLGQGKMGLTTAQKTMPLFIFGGIDEYWTAEFGKKLDPTKELENQEFIARVANTLDSIVIGKATEREAYFESLALLPLETQETFKAKWLDKKRSSLNNIGAVAVTYANFLKSKLQENANG